MASGSVKMGTIFMLLLILKLYNLETFMRSNFVVEISTQNCFIYMSEICGCYSANFSLSIFLI